MTIIERLTQSGIRRLGSPARGFRYRDASGRTVSSSERARIESLTIPPAWKSVAIHSSRHAWVQAVGQDVKGRWQYLYHPKQVVRRERGKHERLVRFIRALPQFRRAVKRDLALPGLSQDRVLAGIARILETCQLRPGGEVYARENGSFGIATLRTRHVSVRGQVLQFDFVGKSGKRQVHELKDRAVAKLVRELLRHRGEVFKYRNDQGTIADIKGHHINAYIRDRMGERFTAKDFRTWAGTLLAARALARMPPESRSTPTAARRAIAQVMREVSGYLGNTPAVCRASYVFPVVLRCFEQGRVLKNPGTGIPRGTRALERCERGLLRLLASTAQGKPS
ncbi:MAG: DNA topoisomerase IB [Candidatus Eisenbacteria bacterium]